MQKIILQLVICQLNTTIDQTHRKNDIIYTDIASYKTYFKEYSNLIKSIDDLFNTKYKSSCEYIMTKPFPNPDVIKKLPNNLTSENFVQKIAQEIWNIPEGRINDFEYVIYQN